MAMAGGIFLWSGTPGGSGAFVSAAPQRDLRALAGTALLWGSVALFAPAQPIPAAADSLSGTHQLAIHQSQNRSWISRTFQAPAAAAPDIVRSIYVYEQRAENPRGFLKAPQIDALPILRALPSIGPQDPTQLAAQVWKQPPAEASLQPTLIRALSASPQADPSQLHANLWAPATAPAPDRPAIHFLQAAPQLVDLTVRNRVWGPWSVVAPPIRPFTAGPQRIDLTQQALIFHAQPAAVVLTPPPNRPFIAGPLTIDVARYSVARVTFCRQPPASTAALLDTDVIVPYLIEDVLSAALMRIASIYCVANVIGTTGSVTIQSPVAFTRVPRGTTITITLGGTIKGSGSRRAQAPYGVPDTAPPFPDPKINRH